MRKLFLVVIFCSAFLLIVNTASAIPTLGVAPGAPGDSGLATASFDGFPMPLSGGSLTIWYGNNGGGSLDLSSNIWLLTTSANGANFSFTPDGGSALSVFSVFTLSVASYKDPVYGTNLGNASSWGGLNETFYSYDFGGKNLRYLNGDLRYRPLGAEIGDWMYAVLDNGGKILVGNSRQKQPVSMATPEPTTMLLLVPVW